MSRKHEYELTLNWTGNTGMGTLNSNSYERSHSIFIDGKPEVLASSDPIFRGDKSKHNPEEFLVSALSSCHMLAYLHLCALNGVVVTSYVDKAHGTMVLDENGIGRFTEVVLNPVVIVSESLMIETATVLHLEANKICFIANSCNFSVFHKPVINCQ